MALITAQQVKLTGMTPSFGAAAAGDKVVADGRTALWVHNGSGGSITVTVTATKVVSGLSLSNLTVTVGAGTDMLIGPFPVDVFGDVNGQAAVGWSATASITRTAVII